MYMYLPTDLRVMGLACESTSKPTYPQTHLHVPVSVNKKLSVTKI